MVIPLSSSKRKRGLSLLAQAGDIMGLHPSYFSLSSDLPSYSPEKDRITYSYSTSNETNNISPTFNLTVNGGDGTDTRNLQRRVKKWVKEGINETLDMMSYKSPKTQDI